MLSRLIAGAAVAVVFGSLLTACMNASIDVSFSKQPARGITTVTVSVSDPTVTLTNVRLDSAGATPIATSTAPSFSFDLDTTVLSEGTHRLFVAAETDSGTRAGDYAFRVANSPPLLTAGFQQTKAFHGLTAPVAVRFAADGRVFVAEKSGLIKVYAGLTSSTPTVFADLRTEVYSAFDHGLLGLALDPTSPPIPTSTCCTRSTRRSEERRRSGTTTARHPPVPRPTDALSAPACRGCRLRATS